MIYSIIDVIEKIIGLRKKVIVNYQNLLDKNYLEPKLRTVVKVLIVGTDHQIHFSELQKVNYLKQYKEDDLEINIIAYDTISKMIDDYKIRSAIINCDTIKDLLAYAVNIEQDILSVLFELKNKLYINNNEKKQKLYSIITELIALVQKQIANYEQYIKNK